MKHEKPTAGQILIILLGLILTLIQLAAPFVIIALGIKFLF